MVDRMICVDVVVASRLLSALMSERLTDVQVSLGQLPTLLALYERDRQTQTELARATGVEQPTMAVNLRRMERDGLIRRVPDPDDGRRSLVHLTARAREIRDVVQSQRRRLDDAALKGVSRADRDTMKEILTRMITNLETEIAAEVEAEVEAGTT